MSTTVFITGATGFIGQAIALAFRRAGYRVYGLVRNEEKAKILKQNEIHVLIGDLEQLDQFKDQLMQADIIVDAIGKDSTLSLYEKIIKIKSGKSHRSLFIGTTGLLLHGSYPHFVDESHEPRHPHLKFVSEMENRIVNSKEVRGVIIRPAAVYGGQGGIFAKTGFSIQENEDLVLLGSLNKRLNWVHVSDLADCYVRVAKAGPIVDGEIFDVAGPWIATHQEWRVAAAKAAGWKGKMVHVPEIPKDNIIAQMFEVDLIVNSQKAYNILGWKENHLGFVAEIDTYYQSYKNSL